MRRAIPLKPAWGIALGVAIAVTPVAAAASLRGMMHAWRNDARIARDMMVGRAAFDANALGQTLRTYADDARGLEPQLNERTPDARDFKQRFIAFRADAQAALADLGERPRLAADLARIFADCQSCHDKFKD